MKITLSIEIDDTNKSVTVKQEEPVSNDSVVSNVSGVRDVSNVVIPEQLDNIGEVLQKGYAASAPRPRTAELPFTVADAKAELKKNNVNITELARALGNFPPVKLRNIFRYDTRRFSGEDYDIILRAIQEVVKSREIV